MKAVCRRFFIFILCGYFLLLAGLFYWQVAADIENHPLNPRRYAVYNQPRGKIVDRTGEVLAETIITDEGTQRVYASSSLSHITGYFHQRFGMTGLESLWNERLSAGQTVHTTIDLKLQKHIEELMGDRVGAIVVMDPKTGQVLAMLSSPYVDSNKLDQNWSDYLDDKRSPFVNRAVRGEYPPGSVIKPLVLAAAIQNRITSLEDVWMDRGAIDFQDRSISNYQRQAFGRITTSQALAHSSNVVFAQLAAELGPQLINTLKSFGLGQDPQFSLPSSGGNLPERDGTRYEWGQIGIGQDVLLVTPLQMAVAISALANGGKLMRPYLVKEISGALRFPKFQRPSVLSQAVPEWAAADVREAMVQAVEEGTAKGAKIQGILTAGKTGTAQTANCIDHGWFVGFAPAYDPEVVVVVLLEHGGLASLNAAPLGGLVLEAALEALSTDRVN